MQRRLVLMRHAHAEQAADDFERPLSELGQSQARAAGAELARGGGSFGLVLASAAPRALSTAQLVAQACHYDGRIRAERSLYLAPEQLCLKTLRALPAQIASVLFVGHNPGSSALARTLSGQTRELAPAEYASLILELEDWSELG